MIVKKKDKHISDEFGQTDIRFIKSGSEFKWQVFKMAYEMSHPKSLERIKSVAEEIIQWVNQ